MEVENPEITSFSYTMEDGQVIEVYTGDELPFPLLMYAEQGVEESANRDAPAEEQQDLIHEDLQAILEEVQQFRDDLVTVNDNISFSSTILIAVCGVLIGFQAAKELLKIWLQ